MNDLSLSITFNDGTVETIDRVESVTTHDGALHAYRQDVYREDVGHWPLVNIRKWLTAGRS